VKVLALPALSLFGLLPVLSSTITVGSNGFTLTATATLPVDAVPRSNTSPGTYAGDSASYGQSYVLSVTGSTGTGWVFPSFTLSGAYNESPSIGTWDLLGALAQINVNGRSAWAGDPSGSAYMEGPSYSCGPNAPPFFCGIPFTFDVPQTVTVQASVNAAIAAGPYAPLPLSRMTVAGSVEFNIDSFLVTDQQGHWIQGATAVLILAPTPRDISVPEPASWALAMLALGAVLFRARRTQH
jgi:MYXO-CTERM domain-containing protein